MFDEIAKGERESCKLCGFRKPVPFAFRNSIRLVDYLCQIVLLHIGYPLCYNNSIIQYSNLYGSIARSEAYLDSR